MGDGSQFERERPSSDSLPYEARVALRREFGGGVLSLEIEDLIQILPHRPPFLLLDRVVALVPGRHAVAVKHVSGDEAGLDLARHGFVFPSTFAVEALGQLAGLVVSGVAVPPAPSATPGSDRPHPWPELAAVESLEVQREVLEPGVLHLSVSRLGDGDEGGVPFAAEASVDGGAYLSARLVMRPA